MEGYIGTLYKLEGTKVVKATSLIDWAEHTGKTNNILCHSTLENDVMISTAFLTIDHDFNHNSKQKKNYKPLIFETMIFGGDHDLYMMRYRTYEEAVKGHHKALSLIGEKSQDEHHG